MDYLSYIISNQNEKSISIQRISQSNTYEDSSNMNASSFITFVAYMHDKMVYVSIKDYMLPLNWHKT